MNLSTPKSLMNFCLVCFYVLLKEDFGWKILRLLMKKKLFEPNPFSNLHNTATQSIIWARGFKNKQAYFLSEPVSANIHGPRSHDWGNYYPFIEGIRSLNFLIIIERKVYRYFNTLDVKILP